MQHSESIAQIAAALAKAQSEMGPLFKAHTANVKSDKGSYSYDYANLADTLGVCLPVLAKHGIALTQPVQNDGQRVIIETWLIHESGEFFTSSLSMPAGGTPQALGSGISYARRYSLQSVVGLAADVEDDDGQEAAKSPPQRNTDTGRSSAPATRGDVTSSVPRAETAPPAIDRAKVATAIADIAKKLYGDSYKVLLAKEIAVVKPGATGATQLSNDQLLELRKRADSWVPTPAPQPIPPQATNDPAERINELYGQLAELFLSEEADKVLSDTGYADQLEKSGNQIKLLTIEGLSKLIPEEKAA